MSTGAREKTERKISQSLKGLEKMKYDKKQSEYDNIRNEQTKTATKLAYAEIISCNKKHLEKELPYEDQQQNRSKRREEEI